MANSPQMPAWKEYALSVVQMHLSNMQSLAKAEENGDKREVVKLRALTERTERLLKRGQIMLRIHT